MRYDRRHIIFCNFYFLSTKQLTIVFSQCTLHGALQFPFALSRTKNCSFVGATLACIFTPLLTMTNWLAFVCPSFPFLLISHQCEPALRALSPVRSGILSWSTGRPSCTLFALPVTLHLGHHIAGCWCWHFCAYFAKSLLKHTATLGDQGRQREREIERLASPVERCPFPSALPVFFLFFLLSLAFPRSVLRLVRFWGF